MAGGEGWSAARLGEIPSAGSGEQQDWKPLRHHFGIRAFGVNAWIGRDPGDEVIEDHDELQPQGAAGHEELYVVTAGRATFTIAGERLDAPAGTAVFVRDPALRRVAVAEEPGTTVLAVGGWPDRPFEPSDWELRHVK
jgi:hypothetical protein